MSMTAPSARLRTAICLLAAGLAGGCAAAVVPATLSTEPAGAKVKVEGTDLGTAPVAYTFDFGKTSEFKVVASQPGYFDATTKVTSDTPDLASRLIKLSLVKDEAYAATVVPPDPQDGANKWIVIQVDSKKARDAKELAAVWQSLVSAATGRYNHIPVSDERTGHLETDWAKQTFPHPDKRSVTVRTQLVTRMPKSDPGAGQALVYEVKILSQVGYGSSPDQWSDYPRVFPDDLTLLNQIRDDLHVK